MIRNISKLYSHSRGIIISSTKNICNYQKNNFLIKTQSKVQDEKRFYRNFAHMKRSEPALKLFGWWSIVLIFVVFAARPFW